MTEENSGYYAALDENFNTAYELLEKEQSHEELISMLGAGNIVQKQLAALKLDTIKTEDEAQILLDNLTGQDGKIREAVSAKIAELVKNSDIAKLFDAVKNVDILLAAIIDINGNVCRNIILSLSNFQKEREFCEIFCKKLLARTLKLARKVNDFDLREGKYKINKEVFKLYWYLETIYTFSGYVKTDTLKEIINITKSAGDYTIREKTAKILSKDFNDPELTEIRQLLKNDTNYYVRRF